MFGALLTGIALLSAGCRPELPSPVADLPALEGLTADPARSPGASPPVVSDVFQVSQILVRYQGAVESAPYLPRTRAGGLERARRLTLLARSQGQSFEDLARRFSEDSRTSLNGGDLGTLARGELHPSLEEVALALAPGQVSDPVETPWGFHVLLRTEVLKVQAGEILVAYDGALRDSPRSPRTRDEAKSLAEAIHRRLLEGASFEDEALAYSDLGNYERGGLFQPFLPGTAHPKFEEMVLALPPTGGLGEVVETPTGFHIVIRLPLRRVRVRILGLEVRDNPDLPAESLRPLEVAMDLAHDLRARALAPGGDFAALITRESEHSTRERGGALVLEGYGRFPPAFERQAFGLAEGELSLPFEADGMVYLLRRVPFFPES